ncbi:MAG: 2-C-methyl-D-erythritol 4-phosphate cytidylyltransferase [Candidatus Nanopelagicaceae bacterium]|jgi:2-C-methyl-D-erythritol 4-phosphate cytidylyltransferase/2-C-methyl-D-erythritol 2,4-cyclodiphosphate synthase
MRSAAIIAAAGSGERFGADRPKAFVQLAGRTLLEHAFLSLSPVVDEIVIAVPSGWEAEVKNLVGESAKVVRGGATRSESISNALEAISPDVGFILVHDAARALASSDLARRVLDSLRSGEIAVIPTLPVIDTIKSITRDDYVSLTPDRTYLRAVQTPQGFTRAILMRAHATGDEATDDATLVEALGERVKVIDGESQAMKITRSEDLKAAYHFIYGDKTKEFRTGVGTDAHAFSLDPNRPLHLGCLLWPGEVGVDGHSDGDVASHAICDALFAAANIGDLGSNFGVDDPKYSGASGATLLAEAARRVHDAGFMISNVTVQIIGNRPKIGPRRKEASEAISRALGDVPVAISATTSDGLGMTGEGKGLAAIATALLYRMHVAER